MGGKAFVKLALFCIVGLGLLLFALAMVLTNVPAESWVTL